MNRRIMKRRILIRLFHTFIKIFYVLKFTEWLDVWIVELKYVKYTGCPRRNVQNFGRVFLMLNYTDITQNTNIQSWTVTEIMAIEKCGLLGCPRIVSRPWRHTHTLRMPGNEKPLANIGMQCPWRDKLSAAACVKCLVTLRTTMTWVRVFL